MCELMLKCGVLTVLRLVGEELMLVLLVNSINSNKFTGETGLQCFNIHCCNKWVMRKSVQRWRQLGHFDFQGFLTATMTSLLSLL